MREYMFIMVWAVSSRTGCDSDAAGQTSGARTRPWLGCRGPCRARGWVLPRLPRALPRVLRHIHRVVGYFEVLAFSEGANLSGDPSDWVLSRAESAARERCDYLTEASS